MPLQVNAFGSLLTPFFTDRPVRDYQSALSADTARTRRSSAAMLARGIYPPPSQFEAWFLSGAHTERDVDKTVKAARDGPDAQSKLTASALDVARVSNRRRRVEPDAQDRCRPAA